MKRTLVISNACFSDRESNGRTLKNLFAKAEPEKLAQFFVYGDPDFSICRRYYKVSDRDALESLNLLKAAGGSVESAENPNRQNEDGYEVEDSAEDREGTGNPAEGRGTARQKSGEPMESGEGSSQKTAGQKSGEPLESREGFSQKAASQKPDEPLESGEGSGQSGAAQTVYTGVADKTPAKMLARELVWLLGRWKSRGFWKWIEEFRPQMLCLFLANNTFLIRLAVLIAKKYQIPLVVYSTEGYCFMNYNYFTNRPSAAYKLYYGWLRASYRKAVPYVTEGFFNCTLLRDRYKEEFGYPCRCVMNGSEIDFIERSALDKEKTPIISYLGNLGLGRHKALMEIAQVLQQIDKRLQLDIYGAAPNDAVKEELGNCPGIRFHGFVSYGEVIRIIHESSLLVHAEWNDEKTNRDLKYAFSTKIGDSISSGTPFLIYADKGLAETIFLKENDCAFVVEKKEMLKFVLQQALTDEKERRRIVENAKVTKEKFFTGNDEFLKAFL